MPKIPKMNPDYQAEVLDHSSAVEDLMGTKGPYEHGSMSKSKKKGKKKKSKKAY